MSKNKASGEHFNIEPHYISQLTRPPIHKNEDEEEDCSDEEIDPHSSDNLYPLEDLKKDLEEVKRPIAQHKSERRQRHPPKHAVGSEKASKFSDYCNLKIISILLILFLGIVVGPLRFFIDNLIAEKPAASRTIDLMEFISDIKNKFEGQDLQTFQILKSSLKRVVNENSKPAAPSIVTIVANKGAENIASDFSIYIGQKLALNHYVSINQSVLHRNPDDLKYYIDNEIKSKFDNRSLNVAVVDRFHNVPIGAAMIFHNYCDHENAPFKRAIFLFIVRLDQKIPETSNLKNIDEVAMQALRHIWRDASDDIVDSLITRLTVSVINIK